MRYFNISFVISVFPVYWSSGLQITQIIILETTAYDEPTLEIQSFWNFLLLSFGISVVKTGYDTTLRELGIGGTLKAKHYFFCQCNSFRRNSGRGSNIMNIHSMSRITNYIILHYIFCSVRKAMLFGMQTWNCPNSLFSRVHCLKCDETSHVSISAKGNLKEIYHFSLQI